MSTLFVLTILASAYGFSRWPWPAAGMLSTAPVVLLWPALYDREHVPPFIVEVRSLRSMYICHKKRHVNTYIQHLPTYPGNKWESESGWGAEAAADGFPSIIQTDRVSAPCGWCLYACVCDACQQPVLLVTHCLSGDVLLLQHQLWRWHICLHVYGCLVCSPTRVTFIAATTMLMMMWTAGLSGLRRLLTAVSCAEFNAAGVWFVCVFFFKANLCTKLLPGNFWFPEVHWGYLGEWLLHSTVVNKYDHVVVSLRGKRASVPQ